MSKLEKTKNLVTLTVPDWLALRKLYLRTRYPGNRLLTSFFYHGHYSVTSRNRIVQAALDSVRKEQEESVQ